MKRNKIDRSKAIKLALLLFVLLQVFAIFVYADPTGTSITYNSTDAGAIASPDNRSDAGGSITTMVLDAVQQNAKWKAYVGNITGTLTLDDSNGKTIFDWSLAAASITGEVYASRAASITWSNINCSAPATITNEQTAIGFTPTDVDSIQNTFNESTHPAFTTAGRTIAANTCNATSTYVNASKQAQASSYFPEILMGDGSNLVYATPIKQDTFGYDNTSKVDFQLILADDPSVTATTYYFYAEIGG